MSMLIEDAQLNWCKGEFELAMKLMQSVMNSKTSLETHIKACGIYGEYLAETCTENTNTIIDEYLNKSIRMSIVYADKKRSPEIRRPEAERKQFDASNKQRNYKAIAKCRQMYGFNHYNKYLANLYLSISSIFDV